jgi:hypothetical protein
MKMTTITENRIAVAISKWSNDGAYLAVVADASGARVIGRECDGRGNVRYAAIIGTDVPTGFKVVSRYRDLGQTDAVIASRAFDDAAEDAINEDA